MTIPRRSRRLILASVAYIGIISFWVGPEDSIWAASLLGLMGGLLGMLNLVTQWWGGHSLSTGQTLLFTSLGGAATGLATSFITALLMTIKTAVHAHGPFTDYPAHVVLDILRRAPLWAAGGLLLGIGLGLLIVTIKKPES